jgi:hypothetical protein
MYEILSISVEYDQDSGSKADKDGYKEDSSIDVTFYFGEGRRN